MNIIREIFRLVGIYFVAFVIVIVLLSAYEGFSESTGFVGTETYEALTFWVRVIVIGFVVGLLMILMGKFDGNK